MSRATVVCIYCSKTQAREGRPDANGATHTERGPGPSKTAPRHRPPPRPERRPEPTRVGPETTSRDHTRPRTNPGTCTWYCTVSVQCCHRKIYCESAIRPRGWHPLVMQPRSSRSQQSLRLRSRGPPLLRLTSPSWVPGSIRPLLIVHASTRPSIHSQHTRALSGLI